MLTAYDGPYRVIGEISSSNKEAYCRRHGHRFVCRTDGFDMSRPAPWSKIPFIRQELDAADWVLWSDADALVMNGAVPVTRFVQDCADIVLSGDPWHGLNTGHMLVRATDWSREFLERVYARTEFLNDSWWENAAVIALYSEDPEVRRHIAVVPNKLFNAYPYPGGNYATGDFMVHFPSLRRPALDAAMRSYAAMAR
jgi:hypothetical protein